MAGNIVEQGGKLGPGDALQEQVLHFVCIATAAHEKHVH